mgnify:CR=1 FL=1
MTKKITVHLAAFFAAIAVMWGLLVLTSLIPNEKIYDGLMESADYYGNTEAFSFENSGKLCASDYTHRYGWPNCFPIHRHTIRNFY